MSLDLATLYRRHLDTLDSDLADAIERAGAGLDGVAFHSGEPTFYWADDRAVPFVPAQHFRRWVPPLDGPSHCLLARPGKRPLVVVVVPEDFWEDPSPPQPSYWQGAVELEVVATPEAARQRLRDASQGLVIASIGPDPSFADALAVPAERHNPPALLAPLDWRRAVKTDYEIALVRSAVEAAARGHRAARAAFDEGGSERQVYRRYLEAIDSFSHQTPYGTIVAFDDKSAILHYQHKRGTGADGSNGAGSTLLLDGGAEHHGYAADLTRTWIRDGALESQGGPVPELFQTLIERVDAMERDLVAQVAPGCEYVDIHLACHRQTAEILVDLGVLRCSVDEAVDTRLTRAFMPHGTGHLIGLQVHDPGGHQAGPDGGTKAPPDGHSLRNTRRLEPGHLVTIEPGIYAVPLLLDPLREGSQARAVDWDVIDQILPWGGVRIEDDVLCTETGFEDLSRPLLPRDGR